MTQPSAIPILIYHSVTRESTRPYRRYAIDPGRFAAHMEHIAACGFRTMTVSELVTALRDGPGSLPEKRLLITFDDGFEEVHSVVLSILSRLNLRSTAYVTTEAIGGRSRWLGGLGEDQRRTLTSEQIKELDAAGVEIGSHGHHHVALDELPVSRAAAEIELSRRTLEEIVGHSIASFAYPYGYHTEGLKRQVRAAGFESACAVKQALSHAGDDRYALARAIVDSEMPMEDFDAWIHGRGLPVSWRRERVRTRAWRFGRRLRHLASRDSGSSR